MSRCALRRWGSGVNCTKEPDTAASKEMGEKLAAMRAERDRQDTMWGGTQASPQPPVQWVAEPQAAQGGRKPPPNPLFNEPMQQAPQPHAASIASPRMSANTKGHTQTRT